MYAIDIIYSFVVVLIVLCMLICFFYLLVLKKFKEKKYKRVVSENQLNTGTTQN